MANYSCKMSRPRSRGTPSTKDTKFRHKTTVINAAHSEDFGAVLIQSQNVTDGRTDRRTVVQAMAKSYEAFCCRA